MVGQRAHPMPRRVSLDCPSARGAWVPNWPIRWPASHPRWEFHRRVQFWFALMASWPGAPRAPQPTPLGNCARLSRVISTAPDTMREIAASCHIREALIRYSQGADHETNSSRRNGDLGTGIARARSRAGLDRGFDSRRADQHGQWWIQRAPVARFDWLHGAE